MLPAHKKEGRVVFHRVYPDKVLPILPNECTQGLTRFDMLSVLRIFARSPSGTMDRESMNIGTAVSSSASTAGC